MAQVTPLTFNTTPPAASISCAWSADGAYLAVTQNTSSGVQLVIYKLEGDQLIQVASEANSSWAYGTIGVAWHASGDILFVQCNRTSGQIPSNYTVFFTFNKATNALTHFLPPRPNPTGTGLGYGAMWWGDYALTHHSLSPYFPVYRWNGGTSLTHIVPISNTANLGNAQVSGYALHPNGSFALAISSNGDVVKITKSGETFTFDDVTLPNHVIIAAQLQNLCWDETGTYLLVTNHSSDNELYQYNSGTNAFVKLTLPSSTANRGRTIFWCTRRKGFVQSFHSTTTTAKPQILKRNETTGVWGYSVYEEDLPVIPNSRDASAVQNSSLIAISTTTAPTTRAFRIVDVILAQGGMSAKFPTVAGNISVPNGVDGKITAPKAVSSGLIGVPNGVYPSSLVAPKASTEGAISASVGEEPAQELFRTYPAVVMIENSAFGFDDQDATSIAFYGDVTAPKATFAGRFKQPVQVTGTLTAPKAKATGSLFLIEPDRRTLIAEWAAPKPAAAGGVSLGLSVMASNLTAPKARFGGVGELPAAGRADLVAPKPNISGLLYHYYVRADMIVRLPTAKGTLEQPRVTIDEGLGRAPLPLADGSFELLVGVRAPLSAPKGHLATEVWQDVHANGVLTAPKPHIAGELAAPAFEGSLIAPKGVISGVIEAPIVFGNLLAPSASLSADITVATGVSGNLRAPKAKLIGEVLRYIRVDILARAPSAKLSGQIHRVPRLQGSLKAPKSKISGTVKTGYDLQAAALAPAGTIAGELVAQYLINSEGQAPSAILAGGIKLRYLLEGSGLAPSPVADGTLGISVELSGGVAAPAAKFHGAATQFMITMGDLVAPKANTDGEIQQSNLVTIAGFSPAARFTGTLKLEYVLEGDLSAPSATSSGFLQSQLEFFGEAVGPNPTLVGDASLLMKRRQFRIIVPFDRATTQLV